MKNTTIPITATIVFSAAVAVLNVAQNEPSRLHANGFQTLGTCYAEDEEKDNNCVDAGWWGPGCDGKGGKGDPAKHAVGTLIWLCEKNTTKNAKEKTAILGTSESGDIEAKSCFTPTPENYMHVIRDGKGNQVWSPGAGTSKISTENKCGTYKVYVPKGKPCDETK